MLTSVGGKTMSRVTLQVFNFIFSLSGDFRYWLQCQYQYPDPDHHHQSWFWSKTYFVEMGSDMLLLFAWQVSTVPRSSLCNGPTWAKNLNIVLLLSSRLIHLIARKNLTKAKQFYYGRVVEIKLKSLDLAGTPLVALLPESKLLWQLFWEDLANLREVVSFNEFSTKTIWLSGVWETDWESCENICLTKIEEILKDWNSDEVKREDEEWCCEA